MNIVYSQEYVILIFTCEHTGTFSLGRFPPVPFDVRSYVLNRCPLVQGRYINDPRFRQPFTQSKIPALEAEARSLQWYRISRSKSRGLQGCTHRRILYGRSLQCIQKTSVLRPMPPLRPARLRTEYMVASSECSEIYLWKFISASTQKSPTHFHNSIAQSDRESRPW